MTKYLFLTLLETDGNPEDVVEINAKKANKGTTNYFELTKENKDNVDKLIEHMEKAIDNG